MQGVGGIKQVYAVLSREDGAEFARNNNLEALFHVDDPGPRVPVKRGADRDGPLRHPVLRLEGCKLVSQNAA
jgi:hypothetical protein